MFTKMKYLKNNRYLISSDELGSGAFAKVYPGKDHQTNSIVAIKKIDSKKHSEHIQRIDQECQLHQSLPNNQHILKFIDNFNEQNFIYIVTEICEFGDLENFVTKFDRKILPEDVARLFSYQILLGFISLYDIDIIHRDMKLQNILINKNFECKIADFGLAKSSQDPGQTQVGTPLTMAPEVLFGDVYDKQCDVWSFGCIVYAMTHGKYPFFPTGNNKRRELEELVKNRTLVFDNPNISDECKQFINKTLQKDPTKRITFYDMFNEPWFQSCQESGFDKQVIDNHLKNLTYKEVHLNQDFAVFFGVTLRHYVDTLIHQYYQLINSVYSQFLNKSQQTEQEKKILYLLNLLITKMIDLNLEFTHNNNTIQLPLTQQSIQKIKSIINQQNYEKSKQICRNSEIDFEPVLQTLVTNLLQVAQFELEKMQDIQQYQADFGKLIDLIDIMIDNNQGLPFSIQIDKNKTNQNSIDQIDNISIKEAYLNCELEYFQEKDILDRNIVFFKSINKNILLIPSEKEHLNIIKEMIQSVM